MFTPQNRLRAIFSELDMDVNPANCDYVAKELNKYNKRARKWTGPYIRNIINGKQEASRFIVPAIMKLLLTPRTRWGCIVDFDNEEDLRKVQKLSMNTRRRALLDAAEKEVVQSSGNLFYSLEKE